MDNTSLLATLHSISTIGWLASRQGIAILSLAAIVAAILSPANLLFTYILCVFWTLLALGLISHGSISDAMLLAVATTLALKLSSPADITDFQTAYLLCDLLDIVLLVPGVKGLFYNPAPKTFEEYAFQEFFPLETREEIWLAVLSILDPRFIHPGFRATIPTLLHTCHQSRELALRSYRPFPAKIPRTYIDFARDGAYIKCPGCEGDGLHSQQDCLHNYLTYNTLLHIERMAITRLVFEGPLEEFPWLKIASYFPNVKELYLIQGQTPSSRGCVTLVEMQKVNEEFDWQYVGTGLIEDCDTVILQNNQDAEHNGNQWGMLDFEPDLIERVNISGATPSPSGANCPSE